mgnify:CR=1 FL=1
MFKKKKKIEEEALGEEVALGSVGGEIIGNIYENPELLEEEK